MKHVPSARDARRGNILDIAGTQANACVQCGIPHSIMGVIDSLGGTNTRVYAGHRLGYECVIVTQAPQPTHVRHVAIGVTRYAKDTFSNVAADIEPGSEWCTVACQGAIICIMTPYMRLRYAIDALQGRPV
ncbi:Ribosomal silencing factor RsfS [Candidatus Tremblaya princeps]|uniref:Ribosomal silencing factor RsfS n=1 Tax=Tremblaya princeps TaxID=189385 RepID=A0A143WMP1_TREPR|nr:Ribosomal silencing factor RsfS [Candidatus Tremblaya princeps]